MSDARPSPEQNAATKEHYINPIIAKKPNHVTLHCGTNDLKDSNPEDIAEKIKDLAIKVTKNEINCTVSSLIMRINRDLNEKKLLTNKKLKTLLASEKINFITQNSITQTHLNRGGLHLNKRGDAALAYIFIETIRNGKQHI